MSHPRDPRDVRDPGDLGAPATPPAPETPPAPAGPPATPAGPPAAPAGPPATPNAPAAPRRPMVERIGMAAIAVVLAVLFGAMGAAAWLSGEPFLAVMAIVGALMTAWVGLLTLVRG
jgi:hypothetical protein